MDSATLAITKRLVALKDSTRWRSMSRQVADVLPAIEEAIASGVSYAAIGEALNQSGVPVSPETLKVYLYRLRKAQRAAAAQAAPKRTTQPGAKRAAGGRAR